MAGSSPEQKQVLDQFKKISCYESVKPKDRYGTIERNYGVLGETVSVCRKQWWSFLNLIQPVTNVANKTSTSLTHYIGARDSTDENKLLGIGATGLTTLLLSRRRSRLGKVFLPILTMSAATIILYPYEIKDYIERLK